MLLKATRFVALILAALMLGMGLCHLMQLPSRLAWDQYLWVGSTVQGGLYEAFGTVGALVSIGTMIALGLVAHFVREHHRPGFRLVVASAMLFALAIMIWWVVVYPVNVELAKWVNGPGRAYRLQRAGGVRARRHAAWLPLTASHMQRALVDGERRFLHRFVERRMRVAGAGEILGRSAELHQHDGLGDHRAGIGADDVHAEHAVCIGIG